MVDRPPTLEEWKAGALVRKPVVLVDLTTLVAVLKRLDYLHFQDNRPTGGSHYVVIDAADYDITDDEMAVLERYLG